MPAGVAWLALGLVALGAAGCVPSVPAQPQTGPAAPSSPTGPKRVVAVVVGEYPTVISNFYRSLQGNEAVEASLASSLFIKDQYGTPVPILAQAVPTAGNGLWKVFSDGTMEVTWNLRPNAVWHDGTPFTTDDLLFTFRVGQENVAPNFRQDGQDLIDRLEAISPTTITAHWKSPYIGADSLFSNMLGGTWIRFPLPRHILESALPDKRDTFTQLSYWSDDFVGTGPFRLKEFARGSRLVLSAFDRFVLGRPKIDELEVKFVGDANAQIATLLSGAADMTLGHSLSVEQAAEVEPQWTEGYVDNIGLRSRFALYPQFLNPNPAIILNLQFRKALMYALDRQEMADSLQRGKVPVAHSHMGPDNPMYATIEPLLVKYDYDPRRAAQMIEALGYTRGSDGIFRDGSGQRLSVEERATPGDLEVKMLGAIQGYWQAVGVESQAVPIPLQRQSDQEYRATRPGFEMTRRGTELANLLGYRSSEVPTAENGYAGSNSSRYANPDWDALLARVFVTVPLPERTQIAGQINRFLTDQLNMMHIFYDSEPVLISHRLVNVHGRGAESTPTWNVYEWDLKR